MKESSSNKNAKTQNLTTYAGLIKFDKIWEYHNGGPPQMSTPKFTLLTCSGYPSNYKGKIKFGKKFVAPKRGPSEFKLFNHSS